MALFRPASFGVSALTDHHVPEEILLDYASGTLSPGLALLVACHMTYCPVCRATVQIAEAVGGHLALEGSAPASPGLEPPAVPGDVMAAVAAPAMAMAANDDAPSVAAQGYQAHLPRPLLEASGLASGPIPWQPLFPGLSEWRLTHLEREACEVRLLRIAAGRVIPRHTHEGLEATMVLSGAFRDGHARYGAGDVCLADGSVDHRPEASADGDCICLAVSEAPLRLTGPFGRILTMFGR